MPAKVFTIDVKQLTQHALVRAKKLGISRYRLAKQLDITQATISKWANTTNDRRPNGTHYLALIRILDELEGGRRHNDKPKPRQRARDLSLSKRPA